MNNYNTISKQSKGLFKDKGSKFISIAFPLNSENEFKSILAELKKQFHDARHFCFAYRIGTDRNIFRINDDGEPNNSAGKPILGQIDSFALTNIGIIVVRYFGGVKLGVGGLIKAYKEASKDALLNADIILKDKMEKIKLHFNYAQLNQIMHFIKTNNLTIINQQLDLKCIITVNLPIRLKSKAINILDSIANISYNIIK